MLIITPSGETEEFNPDKIKSAVKHLTDQSGSDLTAKQFEEIVSFVKKRATYLFQTELNYTVINSFIYKALIKYQPHLAALFIIK